MNIIAPMLAACLACAAPAIAADQSPRDGAVAMTKAAHALIKEQGHPAADAFADPNDARFHDHDLYVVWVDKDNKIIMEGAHPAMAGADVTGLTDQSGRKIVSTIRKAIAETGEGWVNYMYQNSETGDIEERIGYFEATAEGGFVGVDIAAQ